MQLSMFLPDVKWTPPSEFPEITGPAAWDLETRDPNIDSYGPGWVPGMEGHIAGIAVSSRSFTGYFPIDHLGGGNLDKGAVLRWAAGQLKRRGPKIFANAPYDVGWLKKYNIEIHPDDIHDVQIQAPLIDEHRRSFSLDALGQTFAKERKDTKDMDEAFRSFGLKKGRDIWKLPAIYVGQYAEQDAALTLKLWDIFNEKIREDNLERIYELERRLIYVSMMMRWNGVRVDLDAAERLGQSYRQQEKDCLAEIKRMTGLRIDPWAPRSIAMALKDRGFTPPLTVKGQDSITAEYLESLNDDCARLVLRARKLQKAYGTFVDGHVLGHQINGRVHAQFNQMRSDDGGTISGRYSSSNPNLQQIPARDPEFGKAIRGLFVPNDGELWCSADFSSQEPRLTVHFAALIGLQGAEEAVEKYRTDPRTDYHQMVADICGIPRKAAKTINLGLAYGMGEPKLCHSLGLPTEWIEVPDRQNPGETKMIEVAGPEGKKILEAYDAGAPFIRKLYKVCSSRAETRGYIVTLLGRKCRFPRGPNGKIWYSHTAMNRLIQGSAADQTKECMVQLYYDHGVTPLLQIHDELCFSAPNEEQARKYVSVMENAVDLLVPTVCDPKIGANWGECKD